MSANWTDNKSQTAPSLEQRTRSSDRKITHFMRCHYAAHVLFSVYLKKQKKQQHSVVRSVCSSAVAISLWKWAYLSARLVFLSEIQSLASHIRGAFSLIFYLFTFFFSLTTTIHLVSFGFRCMCAFRNHICAIWAAKWCWSCWKEQALKAHWTV